jgi:hypothetical protein
LFFRELDATQWEVRKVEVYGDGRMESADGKEQSGNTDLGLVAVPPFQEIASNPIFESVMMSAEEFEVI